MSLSLQPISQREALEFIQRHHRHHSKPQGWLFGIGVNDGSKVVGVAVVGRPVARMLQDGYTAEVTRLATDGTKNAPSILYAACWRAVRAIGYKRLITYILASESGVTLKAVGWLDKGLTGGGSWSRTSRPRVDTHPLEQKRLFEAA